MVSYGVVCDGRWFLHQRAEKLHHGRLFGVKAVGGLPVFPNRNGKCEAGVAIRDHAEPSNSRYSYVYAVALNSTGHADGAIAVLEQAHQRRPADRQVLAGLIAFERDKGNLPSAITYAQQLVQLNPNDPDAQATLAQLRAQKP